MFISIITVRHSWYMKDDDVRLLELWKRNCLHFSWTIWMISNPLDVFLENEPDSATTELVYDVVNNVETLKEIQKYVKWCSISFQDYPFTLRQNQNEKNSS